MTLSKSHCVCFYYHTINVLIQIKKIISLNFLFVKEDNDLFSITIVFPQNPILTNLLIRTYFDFYQKF